jgi:ribosomal-protein-alanine N-acetyltransferase
MLRFVLIRRATPADRDAITHAAAACRVTIDAGAELARDYGRVWVADLSPTGPAIAGVIVAWAVADELHVIDVLVRPECRRRGVARALVAGLVGHARPHAFRLALLEVRRSNTAAIELYRSAGFQPVGVRERYYSDPTEDAILMQLLFDGAP